MIWLIVLLVVVIIAVVLIIILTRPPVPSGTSIPLVPVLPPAPPVTPMPCLNTSMTPGQWYYIVNRRIVNNRTYYLNVTDNPVNGRYNTILSTDGFVLPNGLPNSRFAWLLVSTGVLANNYTDGIARRIFATIPYVNVVTDTGAPDDTYYWSTQNGAITSADRQWAIVPVGITSYYVAGLQTYNTQNTQQCGWEYIPINIR